MARIIKETEVDHIRDCAPALQAWRANIGQRLPDGYWLKEIYAWQFLPDYPYNTVAMARYRLILDIEISHQPITVDLAAELGQHVPGAATIQGRTWNASKLPEEGFRRIGPEEE